MDEAERDKLSEHDQLLVLKTQFAEYRKAMEERLGKLNELREQTTSFQQAYLRNDVYTVGQADVRKRIEAVNDASMLRHDSLQKELSQRLESIQKELEQRIENNYATLDERIRPVTTAQSKMQGIGQGAWGVIVAILTLLGLVVGHLWK